MCDVKHFNPYTAEQIVATLQSAAFVQLRSDKVGPIKADSVEVLK